MSTGLLYSIIDERYKNKNLIVDYERGEIIDPESGIVLEDHLPVDAPNIRASDYAEWESKRRHGVLVEEKDRRIRSVVYRVGKRVNAPQWLYEDVIDFIKKAVKAKGKLILGRNNNFSVHNEKFVLAVFYVLSLKRGLTGLAESIGKMKCYNDVPCYLSRRLKDREFHKYMTLVMKLWFIMNRRSGYFDEAKNYVNYFVEIVRRVDSELDIIKIVTEATQLLRKYNNRIGTFRPRNFAAAIVVASIASVYGEGKANVVLRSLIKNCSINETSVRNILKKLSDLENGGDK